MGFDSVLFEPNYFVPLQDEFLLGFYLLIGFWLVALTEEYVFRYKLSEFLTARNYGLRSQYLITSIMFALVHLPQGLVTFCSSFVWGLFLFYLFKKSQSLQFVIIAHYLVNVSAYGLAYFGI